MALEGQRPNDVPETKAHEQDRIDGDLLGMAGGVGSDQGIEKREVRSLAVCQVIADLPYLSV